MSYQPSFACGLALLPVQRAYIKAEGASVDGMILLLLLTLFLGFVAGYRHGKGLGGFPSKPMSEERKAHLDHDLSVSSEARAIDPVCGKLLRPEFAKASVYRGSVYYFCSPTCREVFESAPHRYAEPKS